MARLHLTKSYDSPFVVDKGKLARIANILERAGGDSTILKLAFAVQFRTGRRLNLRSVEEVISLDNPSADHIVILEIGVDGEGTSASVKYDAEDQFLTAIRLNIYESDNKKANELYGELDEQIDRTLTKGWLGRMGLIGRMIVTVAFIAALFVLLVAATPTPQQSPSFDATLAGRARTVTSDHEKLQIIFEKTVHDLQPTPPPQNTPHLLTPRTLFIALPVIIVAVVFLYSIWKCYPFAVFAWGDREQEYKEILARRRTLWTVIIAATVLGIVSNLFVASLPAFR